MGSTTLKGCGTALVTPFSPDGSAIDEGSLRRLLRYQIESGIHFLCPCGTTGEVPTLTHEETLRVVEIAVSEARPARVPVYAGAGGNNTAKIIELAREYERLGVDGILSVSPYYNKPTQEGLYQHYRAIAAGVRLPIIVYNVPGRTGSNVEPGTLARLAEIDNIVAVKEASGNITQMAEIANRMPEGFAILSGDDAITLPLMALGGVGVISVASNEVPGEMAKMVNAALRGDLTEARRRHRKLFPLMQINFIESSPIPVKAALAMMGLIEESYRLPLVPMRAENKAKLRDVLEKSGVYDSCRTYRVAV
jgi:4-hydroxy-tetrahydrodipicolinate synthase